MNRATQRSGTRPGNTFRGRLLVITAALMWSSNGFFAKAPLFDDWPMEIRGTILAFWRALFAGLVLVPMVRRPRWTPNLVPMILLFAAMNFTFLGAMARTTAANAIWLQNTAPLWVFLVGVYFFGEWIKPGDLLLLIFGVLGVGFILLFEMRGASLGGTLYGLFSGIFYGGVVLSIRLLRSEDSAWLITLNHFATAVLFFPLVLYYGIWPTTWQTIFLACFGIFQMGVPYLLFARGVQSISGHEASGFTLIEPLLVPVWVYIAWHNAPSYTAPAWWTLVGGALILTGLVTRLAIAARHAQARG